MSLYCEHGNMRRNCAECRADALFQAEQRAAENRERGDSGRQRGMVMPTLTFPWQREAFDAWHSGGRSGLVALSPGLPMGDLPYAVVADLLDTSLSTNVLLATAVGEADEIAATLADRFGLRPTRLIDHHFMEPREDGTLLVADLDELRTVALTAWGRFASTGLLVLLDADQVGQEFGRVLLECPFASRFCLSRQPSAMDLLVSRPWASGFGPLLYRYTEAQARDVGILPRLHYKLHVEMLRPDNKPGPEGPWDPTDIPTTVPAVAPSPFIRGKARDVAIARAAAEPGVVIIHDGAPIKEAAMTVSIGDLPDSYADPPAGWVVADPALGARGILRIATNAFKALGGPGRIEDVVALPVPADLCRVPPWDDRWRSAARQIDRAAIALLLADDPGAATSPEELEALVGVALALRGIPAEELHALTDAVTEAANVAHDGSKVAPEAVVQAARSHGGLAAALLVAAESGPAALLRLAHPGFTPSTPDLPNATLFDARRHAWRGRAFMALANAAMRGDLITAWGRFPELRFIFPSSLLLEAATTYCKRHRLKGPLDDAQLLPIDDRTQIANGDRDAAIATLKEWNDALGIAEEHEREFLARLHERQPERERRREGVALSDLRLLNKDRDTVTLESRHGRFPGTNISPGSEVALVEQGDRKEIARGLVSRLASRRITIEFPSGPPHRLPAHITVNLTFDAKVFEAYHSAVAGAQRAMSASTKVDDGPDGLLRAALLGEVPPARPRKQPIDLATLTPSQKEAIEAVLSGGRVRLIHGPPGTGKTHTLVHLAMALSRAGHSVLVTSDSNAAVDNLVVGLRRNGAPAVRVGHAPNIRDKAVQPSRIDPGEAPRFVRWAAEQGIVVATTNYGAFRYLDKSGTTSPFVFDYVIHDEAGQSTAPSSLAAVMRGRRLVLAGDPLQLPPTVVSMDAKDAGLDVTLFEKIEEHTGRDRTQMIKTQFRSREAIMAFSNARYYEGEIETADVAEAQESLDLLPVFGFQHVTGKENPRQKSGSISNDWEVEAVAAAIAHIQSDVREKGWTFAVLTPYQAQREAIRRRLPEVEVSTVDGAQGREWDIVLYSAVRSNPRHRLGFLADERRLNVAVTRAKRNFLLIGDERTLRDHEGFQELISLSEKTHIRYASPAVGRQQTGRGGPRGRSGGRRGGRQGGQGQGSPGNSPAKGAAGGPRRGAPRRAKKPAADGKEQEAGPVQGEGDPGAPKKRRRRRRGRRRGGSAGPGGDEPDKAASQSNSDSKEGAKPAVEGRAGREGRGGPRRGAPRGSQDSRPRPHQGERPKQGRSRPAEPSGDREPPSKKSQAPGSSEAKPKPKAKEGAGTKDAGAAAKAGKAAPAKCVAKTKAGTPCRNKAKPGSNRCGVHG